MGIVLVDDMIIMAFLTTSIHGLNKKKKKNLSYI